MIHSPEQREADAVPAIHSAGWRPPYAGSAEREQLPHNHASCSPGWQRCQPGTQAIFSLFFSFFPGTNF